MNPTSVNLISSNKPQTDHNTIIIYGSHILLALIIHSHRNKPNTILIYDPYFLLTPTDW